MAKKKKSTLSKEYAGYIKAVRNLKSRQRTQWKKHGIIIDVPVLTPTELKSMGVTGATKGQLTKLINSLRGDKLISLASAVFNPDTNMVEYLTPKDIKSINLPNGKWSPSRGFYKDSEQGDTVSDDDSLWYRTVLANFKDMANRMVHGSAYTFIMNAITDLENQYGKVHLGKAIYNAFENGSFNMRQLFYREAPAQEFIRQVKDFLTNNYGLSQEDARQFDELNDEIDEYDE